MGVGYPPIQQNNQSAMGPGLAAGISAGSGIIGSILSNRANRKMARYQTQVNLDMWNRNNEYNTPANQMARLTEAGLNPHLMYGQGTTGNAPGPVKAERPDMQYRIPDPAVLEKISTYQNVKQSKAQVSLMDEQENLTRQKAVNEQTQGLYYRGRAEREGIKLDLDKNTYDFKISEAQSSADKAAADARTAKLGTVQKGMEIMLTSERIRNLRHDTSVKAFAAALADEGFTPNDSVVIRQLYRRWQGLWENYQDKSYIFNPKNR